MLLLINPKSLRIIIQTQLVLAHVFFYKYVQICTKCTKFHRVSTPAALDSATNWQVGMERFLGVHQHPEKENQSGYKRMVKFLLSDQTVRVVTAAAVLLSKLHLYEVLSNLKEVSERYIDLIHICLVFFPSVY